MQAVILRGENDWSALYVDGDIDQYGDHSTIDERIRQLHGVEVRHGEVWYREIDALNFTIAQTLDEVKEWNEERVAAQIKIDKLLGEADSLRRKYGVN